MAEKDQAKYRRRNKVLLGKTERGERVTLSIRQLMEQHTFIQGTTGSGKSYATRKTTELWLSTGYPVIVLDPHDEFHTLRSLQPDIILVGGEQCDVPLPENGLAEIVRALVGASASAVVQMNRSDLEHQRRTVKAIVSALLSLPDEFWQPYLVVIDEVSLFAPERSRVESSEPLRRLTAEGRKMHFSALLDSQRPADVAKDVLANAANGLVGRTSSQVDKRTAAEVLGFRPSSDEAKSLMHLERGWFWVKGPAMGGESRLIRIGRTKSRHGRELSVNPRQGASGDELKSLVKALRHLASTGMASPDDNQTGRGGGSAMTDLERSLAAEREKRLAAERRVKELERRLDEMRTRPGAGIPAPDLSEEAAGLISTLSTCPRPELSKAALALVSGTTVRSQRFVRPLAELIARDLVRDRKSGVRLSQDVGPADRAGGAPFEVRLAALHAGLDARATKMLAVLAAAHPSKLVEADVACMCGLAPTSRKLKPYLERLSRKGLIVRSEDRVGATDAYVELCSASTVGPLRTAA